MIRTILVVDDNDVCRDSLEAALAKLLGYAVRSVATAEQALEWLPADDICALITDLRLGQMDGFELIDFVRSHPWGASLPIMVISGDSDPGTPARLAKIGADAHFTKPYSPAAVCSKLEQLVDAY